MPARAARINESDLCIDCFFFDTRGFARDQGCIEEWGTRKMMLSKASVSQGEASVCLQMQR